MMADEPATDELATETIERDLARTRARIDGRLDALQEKMTPTQLLNDAFSHFRGSDGADFTGDLIARAKANPLPVALTGIGLAWLIASTHRTSGGFGNGTQTLDDPVAPVRHAEAHIRPEQDEDENVFAERLDRVRGAALGIDRQESESADSYAERLKTALSSAKRTIRETSHDAQASAGEALTRLGQSAGNSREAIKEGTQTMTRSARDILSSIGANPLALGAVAAVVGLVAGSLIPTIEEEERILGSAASKLRTAGRDLAQNVVDRGSQVASDALAAIQDGAHAHGFTGDKPVGEIVQGLGDGSLLSDVGELARETAQASSESVQTQFGSSGKGSPE